MSYSVSGWANRIALGKNDKHLTPSFKTKPVKYLNVIGLDWAGPEGCGRIELKQIVPDEDSDGKWIIDDEFMGKEFAKKLFTQLIDEAEERN